MKNHFFKGFSKLIIAILMLLTFSCKKVNDNIIEYKAAKAQDSASAQVASWDSVTIKDLVSLLGTSIDSLPEIKGYKKEKKEVEDEMHEYIFTWFEVEYKYQNRLVFMMKSNIWKMVFANDDDDIIYENYNINFLKFKDSDGTVIYKDTTANKYIISRITLFSNEVKEGEAYVGQDFGNVRNLVKDKFIVTADTGRVFAVLDEYPEITLELDVSNIHSTDSLYLKHKMIGSLMEIPDSSKIQYIAIKNYIDQDIVLPNDVKNIELVLIEKNHEIIVQLDNKKEKYFLEDLNKLQLLSRMVIEYSPCHEIRIYGKNNEESFWRTDGQYYYWNVKDNRRYKSRENLIEKYWGWLEANYCNYK